MDNQNNRSGYGQPQNMQGQQPYQGQPQNMQGQSPYQGQQNMQGQSPYQGQQNMQGQSPYQGQQNMHGQPPYQGQQNMYRQQPGRQRKKAGFGAGFAVGMVSAVAMVLLVFGLTTKVYTNLTGEYIVIGRQEMGTTANSNSLLDKKTLDKLDELVAYMDIYYYDAYEPEDIQNAICKGAVDGLGDDYSLYYTKEEYEDLQVNTSGNYYGIGAGMTQDVKSMEVTISKVYENTPSEEAGLKDGDVLLKVDEIDATSMELSALVKRIRGEEGTTVHLVVYRETTGETLEFDVTRRNVELPSVEGELLDGNIGYIEISEFQGNTAEQFEQILHSLQQEGMEGLVVDLRANPGGLITAVVDILDVILPEGTVVYTEDKYGNRDTYTSDKNCLDCPIVVLVDEHSASASEIFAGAIKDYQYGTLVGTTTYGKGIVQTVFPLPDGDAVKITTSKYFTPKGNNIHKVGIEPDYEVEYEYSGPLDEDYDMQYDNQVQYGLKLMREMLK